MSPWKNKRVMLAFEPPANDESVWARVADHLHSQHPGIQINFLEFKPVEDRFQSSQRCGSNTINVNFQGLISRPATLRSLQSLQEFSADAGYQQFRFIAIKLLNRSDLTGTFRFVDRESHVMGALLGVIDVLQRQQVDLIVFDVTPHEFTQFLFWSVAEWMGVRVLFFQPSPIAPAMLARTDLEKSFAPAKATVSQSAVSEHIHANAKQSISRLVEGLDPKYMEAQQERDDAVRRPRHKLAALRASLAWIFKERFPESIDFSGHPPARGVLSRTLKIFLTRSLSSTIKAKVVTLNREGALPENYCVFALHYEPERTSLPEGLPTDFQADALVAARNLVPESFALIVKEHYSQQSSSLRGFLGRSPQFYDIVGNFPGTMFASTKESLARLVDNAQCVFTLTGTVAIEAALRGIPVAYFGTPWWGGMPGTLRLQGSTRFEEIVGQKRPAQQEVVTFLENLTLSGMIPGIASGRVETIEDRLGPLPDGFFAAEAKSITMCVNEMLAR